MLQSLKHFSLFRVSRVGVRCEMEFYKKINAFLADDVHYQEPRQGERTFLCFSYFLLSNLVIAPSCCSLNFAYASFAGASMCCATCSAGSGGWNDNACDVLLSLFMEHEQRQIWRAGRHFATFHYLWTFRADFDSVCSCSSPIFIWG